MGGGVAVASSAVPAAASASGHRATAPDYRRACPEATKAGTAACLALIRTDIKSISPAQIRSGKYADSALEPSSLESAYKLTSASSSDGVGVKVAVVDAYNDPNAVSDVATFRSEFGLPACNTGTEAGCLTVLGQTGTTSLPGNAANNGWALEESLDVDMVSAICPNCHIYLMEADSPTTANLGTAVNSAVSLGIKFISNSYGGADSSSDATFDADYYNHPGVAITASAGDDGYFGSSVEYPASSRDVTAVGGTTLKTASNARGWTETVWGSKAGENTDGTGSGCSKYEKKQSWQKGSFDSGCTKRTNNDVSADANPDTGAYIYDSWDSECDGFCVVGGTSEASPIIASVFALAGTPAAGTYPTSYIYAHTSDLFDVTKGLNGSPCTPAYLCHAETGYDGPTGWGTPDGTAAFKS